MGCIFGSLRLKYKDTWNKSRVRVGKAPGAQWGCVGPDSCFNKGLLILPVEIKIYIILVHIFSYLAMVDIFYVVQNTLFTCINFASFHP